MKIKRIITVSSSSLSHFNKSCNKLLGEGYQPHDKIQVISKNWDKNYVQQYIKN